MALLFVLALLVLLSCVGCSCIYASRLSPWLVQNLLRNSCLVATWTWQFVQRLLSRLLPKYDRAPRRLEPPRWLCVSAGCLHGLEKLPAMPSIPIDELSVAFAGCANLSMYMYGVAFGLQKAATGRSVKWRVAGGSSGAFVGAPFAMGIDCAACMLNAHQRFVKERERFGGCVGLYSYSVGGILREEIHASRRAGHDPLNSVAGGNLAISVTHFSPKPTHTEVTEFQGDEDIVLSVLASCYIPVAYELPIVLPGLGFCIDGCVCSFLPNLACVVSPYHVHLADICPVEEYPGTLVFNLLHGDDVLRLFEDGYLDCMKWLQSGAKSRFEERQGAFREQGKSFKAMIWQGWRVFLSLAGFLPPQPTSKKDQ